MTHKTLNSARSSKNAASVYSYAILLPSSRKLIHKKFTTIGILIIVTILSILFSIFLFWSSSIGVLYLTVLAAPWFLLVSHTVYQILCDIKLLFRFNDTYDITPEQRGDRSLPSIAFVIPSYQEPFSVAKMTFDSVINTPYDGFKEIIVVDNSTNLESAEFLKWKDYVEGFNSMSMKTGMCASFHWNSNKETLKPGNLDLAQSLIEKSEFVVFLDVDSTLPETGTLLERSIAEFSSDNRLGFIQFRIKATNRSSNELTEAISINQDFLRLRMVSRGYGGYKIFEGHNGIWRKSVLDVIGPWVEYHRGKIMITEDILKSIQAYAKGYYGKPLNIDTGEWVPTSLKALEGMWMRWMYGNSQVFAKHWKLVYTKHVSVVEKFDISYHILQNYTSACFFFFALLLQISMPGHAANLFILGMYILPQSVAGITYLFTCKQLEKYSLLDKIKHLYSAFFLVETFINYTRLKSNIKFALGVPQGWKVTEKGKENSMAFSAFIVNNLFQISIVFLTLGVCCLSWLIKDNMSYDSLIFYVGFLFININLLICIIDFRKQRRIEDAKLDQVLL